MKVDGLRHVVVLGSIIFDVGEPFMNVLFVDQEGKFFIKRLRLV